MTRLALLRGENHRRAGDGGVDVALEAGGLLEQRRRQRGALLAARLVEVGTVARVVGQQAAELHHPPPTPHRDAQVVQHVLAVDDSGGGPHAHRAGVVLCRATVIATKKAFVSEREAEKQALGTVGTQRRAEKERLLQKGCCTH